MVKRRTNILLIVLAATAALRCAADETLDTAPIIAADEDGDGRITPLVDGREIARVVASELLA